MKPMRNKHITDEKLKKFAQKCGLPEYYAPRCFWGKLFLFSYENEPHLQIVRNLEVEELFQVEFADELKEL